MNNAEVDDWTASPARRIGFGPWYFGHLDVQAKSDGRVVVA
jgi:hypothetical protein